MKAEDVKVYEHTPIDGTELKLTRNDNLCSLTCDGCGYRYNPQEVFFTNIDSCCGGGCCRTLCFKCIEQAYKAMHEYLKVAKPL